MPTSDEPPEPDALDLIPAARRQAVRDWLATSLANCGVCSEPVYPTSSRGVDGTTGQLGHLDCLRRTLSKCPVCRVAITSLDARESSMGTYSIKTVPRR